MTTPDPRGSVRLSLYVEGQWAISLLTDGWSDAEKQALLDEDKEAQEALTAEAVKRTLAEPYNVENEHVVIHLRDERDPRATKTSEQTARSTDA